MKILDLLYIIGFFIFFHGVFRFVWLRTTTKAYKLFAKEGESFFDYCFRELYSPLWELRKFLGLRWFYNCKLFKVFSILFGIMFILLAFIIFGGCFLVRGTEYGIWLDIKL